jgi:hypothetical protein
VRVAAAMDEYYKSYINRRCKHPLYDRYFVPVLFVACLLPAGAAVLKGLHPLGRVSSIILICASLVHLLSMLIVPLANFGRRGRADKCRSFGSFCDLHCDSSSPANGCGLTDDDSVL